MWSKASSRQREREGRGGRERERDTHTHTHTHTHTEKLIIIYSFSYNKPGLLGVKCNNTLVLICKTFADSAHAHIHIQTNVKPLQIQHTSPLKTMTTILLAATADGQVRLTSTGWGAVIRESRLDGVLLVLAG